MSTAQLSDDDPPRDEKDLVIRLITAAHESVERRLTQGEVDTLLGIVRRLNGS